MKPLKEEDSSENSANFQSETIKGLVILFYRNLIFPTSKQYTTAYSLTKCLAKRFNDKKALKDLMDLKKNSAGGYPLGLLQTIAFRDLYAGYKINKLYNYGYKRKPISLGDMILTMDAVFEALIDIFTEICIKNEIDTTFASPIIEGMDAKTMAMMGKL